MGVQSKAVQSINYTCDRCSSKKTVEIAIDVPDTGLMFNGIPAEVEADNMPLDYRETSILGVKYLLCASCAEVNYDLMKMFLSNSDVIFLTTWFQSVKGLMKSKLIRNYQNVWALPL